MIFAILRTLDVTALPATISSTAQRLARQPAAMTYARNHEDRFVWVKLLRCVAGTHASVPSSLPDISGVCMRIVRDRLKQHRSRQS